MSDELLRRSLRVIDTSVQPNPAFVDELHGLLAGELGLVDKAPPLGQVRGPTRPQLTRRGRAGWLAVAALLVLGLFALLLGQLGRTNVEPPPPPRGSPSPSATSAPSSPPSTPASAPASTPPAIPESSPAFDNLRSDGFVVYDSDAMSGLPRLRVFQADLSSVELLPDIPGVQFGAAWRPDGERLAYTSYDAVQIESHPLIWETDAEGAQPVLLSEGCELPTCVAEYEPSYSPDGTQLVFVRTRLPEGGQEESVVAIRDLATDAVTELESTSRPRIAGENLHPRWSPDGQTIAYGVTDYGEAGFPGDSRIHLVHADGSDERVISAPELHAGEPEWSPDGATILFASNPFRPVLRAVGGGPDAPPRLGVMNADGSDARLFDYGRVMVAPSWAANGEQILFTLMEGQGTGIQRPFNPRLFVMDADGNNVLPLSRNPADALYGVQQPAP